MKKIIKKLMVAVVATLALAAFTGCPAAPAAPETPETPETPEKGILESNYPWIIRKFDNSHDIRILSIEFTKDDKFIFKEGVSPDPEVTTGNIEDLGLQLDRDAKGNVYYKLKCVPATIEEGGIEYLEINLDYAKRYIDVIMHQNDVTLTILSVDLTSSDE